MREPTRFLILEAKGGAAWHETPTGWSLLLQSGEQAAYISSGEELEARPVYEAERAKGDEVALGQLPTSKARKEEV